MARHIAPDEEGFVYRAVVEYDYNARTVVSHYGPYSKIGAARAMATRETTGRWGRGKRARVQRAVIQWEEVE